MSTRTTLCTALASFLVLSAAGQFADGLNGSSYNGLWSLESQPAGISLSPNKTEINVISGFADADNSYFHLKGKGVPGLFNFSGKVLAGGEGAAAAPLGGERSITTHARILGPSVLFHAGPKTTLALTTAFRFAGSVTDLDAISKVVGGGTLSYDIGGPRVMNELRFRVAQMAWAEVGAHAAHRFDLGPAMALHAGISAKYLIGIAGMYARNEAPTLTALSGEEPTLQDVDLTYGHSDLGALAHHSGMGDLMQGSGIGVDAGLVWEWKRAPGSRTNKHAAVNDDHRLRIGLAVTDLGSIAFKAGSTHHISGGKAPLASLGNIGAADADGVDTLLSGMLLDDPQASRTGDGMRMALPTTLHATVDVHAFGKVYVNAAASFGMDRGALAVVSPSNISLTPRFQSRFFELGIPVSLYQFRAPRIGAALRVGPLMVGSDKLGGLFGLTDVGGMDVYMGVKVNLGKR